MFYRELVVHKTYLPNVYVRSDGMVSYPYPNGPWVPGYKICVNRNRVISKKHAPKYYYKLWKSQVGRDCFVHRLVAAAFCENPAPDVFYCVDHINGISLDNRSSNLRWVNRVLNNSNTNAKNIYFVKKWQRWKSCVQMNGKKYHLGYYKNADEAQNVSRIFKAAKFTEVYRSYIKNETDTSRACQHIHGGHMYLTTVPENSDIRA